MKRDVRERRLGPEDGQMIDRLFRRAHHNPAGRGSPRMIGVALLLAALLGMVCAPQAHGLGVTVGTVVYDTLSINRLTLLQENITIFGADTFLDTFVVEQLPKTDITSGTQRIDYTKGDTIYFSHHITNLGNGYDSITVSGTTAAAGLQITILQDALTIGTFDGVEAVRSTFNNIPNQPYDTGAVDSGIDILIGVFVPTTYNTDSTTIHIQISSGFMSAKGETDLFGDYAFDTLLVLIPKITATTGGATSQQPSFQIPLDSDAVGGLPDTIMVGIDPGALDGGFLDTCILQLSETGTYNVISGGCTAVYNGETLVIGMPNIPNSDTYTAVLLTNTTLFDSNAIVGQFTLVVDTVAPTIKDTAINIDISSSTQPIVTVPAVADTHSGVETFTIVVTDASGSVVFSDSISGITSIQLPIDIPGTYSITVVAIDLAGNTTAITGEFEITLPLSINVVAVNDNAIAADDIARGLTAQGCVTVEDGEANKSNAMVETILVTLISDVDLIGIPLTLTETTASSSKFTNCFKFTNGASSAEHRKIKVKDGSLVTAVYDPAGPAVEIRDAITWQGIVVTELDFVRTWPNPFMPGRGQQTHIVIQNLPSDPSMTIKVFTTSMELVKVLRVGDGIEFYPNQNIGRWDARNDRGQLIASGTYIYMVEANVAGQKIRKVAKFSVVK